MAVSPAELTEQLAPRSERRVVAGLLAFAVAVRGALLFVGYVQTEISRGNPGKDDVQPTREAFSEAIARLDFADPGWYGQIAQDGYARRPFTTERHENWGFFPGWPLMMRMGAPFLGGADTPDHRRRLHRPADLPLHKPIVVPDLGRVSSLSPRTTTPSP